MEEDFTRRNAFESAYSERSKGSINVLSGLFPVTLLEGFIIREDDDDDDVDDEIAGVLSRHPQRGNCVRRGREFAHQYTLASTKRTTKIKLDVSDFSRTNEYEKHVRVF